MKFEMEFSTKIKFGVGVVNHVGEVLKAYNKKNVLLVYGSQSIKKSNLYDEIINELKKHKIAFVDHGNVQPNPRLAHINEGGLKARKYKCDAVLAVGGGSVVDAAKAMGLLATNTDTNDIWIPWTKKNAKKDSLPIFAFITLAATGSENNEVGVITNEATQQKFGGGHDSCLPLVCFEDPKITASVNKWNTMCGVFDIFTHAFERYASGKLCDWTRFYLAAQIKTVITNSYALKNNLNDLEARGNVLIASSMVLNSIGTFGGATGDWATHVIEHGLSALYDVSHGAGLALILPKLLTFVCEKNDVFKKRIAQLGQDVFNVKTAEATVKSIMEWIDFLELPVKVADFTHLAKPVDKIADINTQVAHFAANAKQMDANTVGSIYPIDSEDARKIIAKLY